MTLTQDLGDKKERKDYNLIGMYLCVKMTRGQLYWHFLLFCLLVVISLIQAKVFWEEGTLIERIGLTSRQICGGFSF